jgi:hypothetical protein
MTSLDEKMLPSLISTVAPLILTSPPSFVIMLPLIISTAPLILISPSNVSIIPLILTVPSLMLISPEPESMSPLIVVEPPFIVTSPPAELILPSRVTTPLSIIRLPRTLPLRSTAPPLLMVRLLSGAICKTDPSLAFKFTVLSISTLPALTYIASTSEKISIGPARIKVPAPCFQRE